MEDELIIAQELTAFLKEKDYEVVVTVRPGEESVETCRKTKPDLIMMDPPQILMFTKPELVYPAIVCRFFETKVIRFPPGFEDSAYPDLALLHQKRDGSLICPVTVQAPGFGTML